MSYLSNFAAFDSIAASILPRGEGSVVAFANVYFDESGTHANSRVMAMAGYWFEADQARKFAKEWSAELKRFGISAAHQTDCALGFGEYKGMSVARRVEIQKSLILHIKRRSRFSICLALGKDKYEEIFQGISWAPSAYSYLLMSCVSKIAEEIEFRKYKGKVAYFFEAGHAKANEANQYMNELARQAQLGQTIFAYAGHAFVGKGGALPLQAADMLAWQNRHYLERMLDGIEEPRKDFVALTRKQDLIAIVEERHLLAMKQVYLNAYEIFGENLVDPKKEIPGYDVAEGILRAHGLSRSTAREVRRWLEKQGR